MQTLRRFTFVSLMLIGCGQEPSRLSVPSFGGGKMDGVTDDAMGVRMLATPIAVPKNEIGTSMQAIIDRETANNAPSTLLFGNCEGLPAVGKTLTRVTINTCEGEGPTLGQRIYVNDPEQGRSVYGDVIPSDAKAPDGKVDMLYKMPLEGAMTMWADLNQDGLIDAMIEPLADVPEAERAEGLPVKPTHRLRSDTDNDGFFDVEGWIKE